MINEFHFPTRIYSRQQAINCIALLLYIHALPNWWMVRDSENHSLCQNMPWNMSVSMNGAKKVTQGSAVCFLTMNSHISQTKLLLISYMLLMNSMSIMFKNENIRMKKKDTINFISSHIDKKTLPEGQWRTPKMPDVYCAKWVQNF